MTRLLLVFSLVLSTQSVIVVQIAFKLRQDVIIEKFCVNRDRPEMHCDGHCKLSQMLKKGARHEQEHRAAMLDLLLSSFSLWLTPDPGVPIPPEPRSSRFAVLPLPVDAGSPSDIFHPPRSI